MAQQNQQDVSLKNFGLEEHLRRVEPGVVLVKPRLLRKILRERFQEQGFAFFLRVPHAFGCRLPLDVLLGIVDPSELATTKENLINSAGSVGVVYLLPRPTERDLRSAPTLLREAWRTLFHLHLDGLLEQRPTSGICAEPAVRQWINSQGLVWNEIVMVLQEDGLLPTSRTPDLLEAHREFVARYLEIWAFDSTEALARHFPGLEQRDFLPQLVEELQAQALLERLRPQGAADAVAHPDEHLEFEREDPAFVDRPDSSSVSEKASPELVGPLTRRAERVAERGNQVRAAILRQRLIARAPARQAGAHRSSARQEIEKLAHRLVRALGQSEDHAAAWIPGLLALLPAAARGFWSVEARLLYDLQKICVDQERKIYAVDLVEWVLSGFAKPIQRHLHQLPTVLTVKHLRKALSRLSVVRTAVLPEAQRTPFRACLEEAHESAEHRLREELRPKIQLALTEAELTPRSVIEGQARDKLTDELLDRIVERGFLNFGDLRDAVAHNHLKIPDMLGPVQLLTGDALIRANRRFALHLDGIYLRGEIYLRLLQRLSALLFGNFIGRCLTLYLLLPILLGAGSFFFLDAMLEECHKYLKTPELPSTLGLDLVRWRVVSPVQLAVVGGGASLYALGLLHWHRLRLWTWIALRRTYRGLKNLLDLPLAFLRLGWVQAILTSRVFQLCWQWLLRPGIPAGGTALLLGILGLEALSTLIWSLVVFVLALIVGRTRLGRTLEEWSIEQGVHTYRVLREDVLEGLFRLIMDLSRWALEHLDRLLYTVDEWLRFRQGESRWALLYKPVLGLIWWVIAYAIRLWVNLLFEPQVNPIKHFPAVTVTAKLMLPILPAIGLGLLELFRPVFGTVIGGTITGILVFFLPGIGGFLIWELKENWRLYRANESEELEPEVIGSHGETVQLFLRPGLHSGTIPKKFAQLRGPQRLRGGRWQLSGQPNHSSQRVRRALLELHHVEERLHHFVERDLLATLRLTSSVWRQAVPEVSAIDLSLKRIRFRLRCPSVAVDELILDLEHPHDETGWLLASVKQEGWLTHLNEHDRGVFENALVGFYKWAGVTLLRQDIESYLKTLPEDSHGSNTRSWQMTPQGLLIGNEKCFNPDDPEQPEGATPASLFFALRRVTWRAWEQQWEALSKPENPTS